MKRIIPFFLFTLTSLAMFGQCDQLFISEYVEGYANNKALEIYNPTSEAILLSDYSVVRFSNGSTNAPASKVQQLPADMIAPGDVYVIVVALTDTADWNSQFDKPAWNGYNVIDTLFDFVTNEPRLDADGNVLFGPQFTDDGSALFGSEYNEEYDLQCKADAFLCPDYDSNNAMYFNGNDAVALIQGTEVSPTGDNILDVIGVIGEDPEITLMEDAWVNADGFWVTKNSTIIRKADVTGGRFALEQVVAQAGGTFMGEEWWDYPTNTFEFLGIHDCVCNAETTPDRYSCSLGPITGTNNINSIPFKMYPNPNSGGSLFVEADENISQISVFNLMGQLISLNNTSLSNAQELNISNLESGLYVVNITFENSYVSIQRLVVE
jgi:hypothetical protein